METDEKWTEFDLKDLKKYHKIYHHDEKEISIISIKLGIDEMEVKKKMSELGLLQKNQNALLIPKTVVHKYDLPQKKGSSFVDEDDLMLKNHDLRAEQVQLQKELISEINKRGNDIVRCLNDFTSAFIKMEESINRENQNLEKMINYIESAMKKKPIEVEQPNIRFPLNEGTLKENTPKTVFKCPQCGRQSVFPRANGVCLCNTCKWEGTKQDLSF